MPPPPPPSFCLPFGGGQKKERPAPYAYSDTSSFTGSSYSAAPRSYPGSAHKTYSDSKTKYPRGEALARQDSYSTTSTLTEKADALTFRTDSELYGEIPPLENLTDLNYGPRAKGKKKEKKEKAKLKRLPTINSQQSLALQSHFSPPPPPPPPKIPAKQPGSNPGLFSRLGYGWGLGKRKEVEKEQELNRNLSDTPSTLPEYQSPSRHNSQSAPVTGSILEKNEYDEPQPSLSRGLTDRSRMTERSRRTDRTHTSAGGRSNSPDPLPVPEPASLSRGVTMQSRRTARTSGADTSSTLTGSAYERRENAPNLRFETVNTTAQLDALRGYISKEKLDFYIVPSEDAHGSEYVAACDKRREFISGFSGSAGTAIITLDEAHLITDSRYWAQAEKQLDSNWTLVRAGEPNSVRDWTEWLVKNAANARIGVDGRMISYQKASALMSKLSAINSKLHFPVQNLVDFVWRDKPPRPEGPIYIQPSEFTGEEAGSKLAKLREWIASRPADRPSYSRGEPKPSQIHVGTVVTALNEIAYILNLRGSDVPFNPVFHAYLFVGFDRSILFVDDSKIGDDTASYLASIGIERRPYSDIWPFLRRREWGEGKIIITPQTSYIISLILSHFRCTVLPSHVDNMLSVKNNVEIEGMRRAYLRDGVAFTQFLAWLDDKMAKKKYDITEWEAANRLTEYRRQQLHYVGLAYENISGSGPNGALPHYSPQKGDARVVDYLTPYVNDSGGQYRDGTCDTTRTVHFGRPSPEQSEAFTRVLQGHIAIDSVVFPDGTSGRQLDVLARRSLWKQGLNYLHGTGHGFGSFLTVHEGAHGFSSDIPLVPGHVVTNEPGFYLEGHWGIRLESALVVHRASTPHEFGGSIWLSFERLTCVPIQTNMIIWRLLSPDEKAWIKGHNQRCLERLTPFLSNDRRAMKWLRKEADLAARGT